MKLNQKELATRLSVNKSTVGRWVQDARWTFGPAPWPASLVPEILLWQRTELERQAEAMAPADAEAIRGLRKEKLQAEIRKLKIQEETARVDLERIRGSTIAITEVRRLIIQLVTAARNRLLALGDELSPQLTGAQPEEIAPIINSRVREILTDLADNAAKEVPELADGGKS